MKQYFLEHPDIAYEIEQKVRQAYGLGMQASGQAEAAAQKEREQQGAAERSSKGTRSQKAEKHVEA